MPLNFRQPGFVGLVGTSAQPTSVSRGWYEDETNLYNPSGTLVGSIVQLQESASETTTQIINPTGTIIVVTEDLQ